MEKTSNNNGRSYIIKIVYNIREKLTYTRFFAIKNKNF